MGRSELDPTAVARVIAAFGFEAVRGRSSTGTGAAPAHRVAGLHLDGVPSDKRTVARRATQGYPAGAPAPSTALPFDFAMAAMYDWSRNGGQDSFQAALEIMAERVVPLDPNEFVDPDRLADAMASLLRVTVQVEFDDPNARFLTGYAIQAMALDYLRHQEFRAAAGHAEGSAPSTETLAWARWLIEQRRTEARQTSESYDAVLSFCLLLFRRRPKPGTSVAQIVRAAQSLWIGGLHRAFLEPDEYPEYSPRRPPDRILETVGLPEGNGQIERAMVELIIGMTEASLFSVNETRLENSVVVAALQSYRTAGRVVPLAEVTSSIGVDETVVLELFPTDEDLASACLRWLAGEWTGFGTFADQFRDAAIAGVEAILEWVTGVRRDFPALLPAARFASGDAAFDEVTDFVANVLSRRGHGASGVPGPDDVKRARRCVEDAASGAEWRARIKLVGDGVPTDTPFGSS